MAYLRVTYKASLINPIVVRIPPKYFKGYRWSQGTVWHIVEDGEICCGAWLQEDEKEFNSVSDVPAQRVCKNCLKELVKVEAVDA